MSQKDYFSLFHLTPAFGIDEAKLEAAKTALLARLHPDRFAAASALDRRIAQQMTVQVNEAYATLSDRLKRAQYLCKLAGLDVNAREAMSADFLMRQMQWHEAVEVAKESRDATVLEELGEKIGAERAAVIEKLKVAFDDEHNTKTAYTLTRELMFIEKLAQQIRA